MNEVLEHDEGRSLTSGNAFLVTGVTAGGVENIRAIVDVAR